jgi:hypothetical protein
MHSCLVQNVMIIYWCYSVDTFAVAGGSNNSNRSNIKLTKWRALPIVCYSLAWSYFSCYSSTCSCDRNEFCLLNHALERNSLFSTVNSESIQADNLCYASQILFTFNICALCFLWTSFGIVYLNGCKTDIVHFCHGSFWENVRMAFLR